MESRIEVIWGWGKGRVGNYCSLGQVSVWNDEKVLEMDDGDRFYNNCECAYCRTTVHLKMVNFMHVLLQYKCCKVAFVLQTLVYTYNYV